MIRIDLDVMLARRKMSMTELSQRVGITMANLSILLPSSLFVTVYSFIKIPL